MERTPRVPLSTDQLPPQELQRAKERNEKEIERKSTTRIYEVESTRTYPDSVEISYGWLNFSVEAEEREHVKPGTKILIVQEAEHPYSPVAGLYILGKNLLEQVKG